MATEMPTPRALRNSWQSRELSFTQSKRGALGLSSVSPAGPSRLPRSQDEHPLCDTGWRWGFSSHSPTAGFIVEYSVTVFSEAAAAFPSSLPQEQLCGGDIFQTQSQVQVTDVVSHPDTSLVSGQNSAPLCNESKHETQNNSCAAFKTDQAGSFFFYVCLSVCSSCYGCRPNHHKIM